jgi:hypothetical protein
VSEGRVAEGCPTPPDPPEPGQQPTLVDLDEYSSLCSTGHTPNIITGAFLRFLQSHFVDPNKIENPMLRDNIFKAEPKDTTEGTYETGILIEPIYKWDPRRFSKRLAIYIKRNELTIQRLGINDGMTVGVGRNEDGSLKTYEGDKHEVGVLGSHTFFCIGRSGAEAEVLASEVFREVQHFAPILRGDLKLHRLVIAGYAEVQQVEEYDQHFVVAITAGWAYIEAWRLIPQAPWLKTLSLNADPS